MTEAAAHYALQLVLNDGALRGLCRGVSDEESKSRYEGGSSFLWIVGHLAEHRAVPLEMLGADRASPIDLTGLFARDTFPSDEGGPSLRELVGVFLRFGEALRARVATLGDAAFERRVPAPGGLEVPVPHFFHFHETYHLGQLGLLRRRLGKSALVPPKSE